MRRFSPVLCCCLLLGMPGLSAPAQEPKPPAPSIMPLPAGKPANSGIAEIHAPITLTPSGPVGVIMPRPLLPLPIPQPTATPLSVAGDSALSLPAS